MPDRRHRRHDRAGLRRRTCRLGRLSRRAAHSACRRNDRAGRRDDRRRARLPLVQLSSRPSVHGQHRRAAAGRPAGLAGGGRPAGTPAGGRRRRVRGRGRKRDRPSGILQVAPPAAAAVRPLHHHFQFLGWAENKIVVRFWIASALCAAGRGVAEAWAARTSPSRCSSYKRNPRTLPSAKTRTQRLHVRNSGAKRTRSRRRWSNP